MDGTRQRDGHDGVADSETPLLKKSPFHSTPSIVHQLSKLFQDWWMWELVGASVSIMALAIIIVILALYDSCSLPDWPSIFTVYRRSLPLLSLSAEADVRLIR